MSRLTVLKDRAEMLAKARAFFASRKILEVDCPLLTAQASVDAHIDLIPALFNQQETRYLHSSPEYGMKRLLTEGIGDCYQLAHVFRDGEVGRKHNPEFMMAEWYRQGFQFEKFIEETLEFIQLFLGEIPYSVLSYREAFEKYLGINPHTATIQELLALCKSENIPLYVGIEHEGKDALLNVLLAEKIEPQLQSLTALAYYPVTQAALAVAKQLDGDHVAARFEVYYKGVELANGYEELADPVEQRKRLLEANQQRVSLGKESLPIDERFLRALEKGLPACCGVAVGFDRLMMLRHEAKTLAEVLSFGWDTA